MNIFDLVNIFYILTIMLIVQKYYNFDFFIFAMLVFHFLVIFLCNGVMFNISLFGDQREYLLVTQEIRSLDFDHLSRNLTSTVGVASTFFAFFPIPFIESVYSIGMINFSLYFFLFIFLYKRKILNSKLGVLFFLFYPSLLLYSSLGLRDMLVFSIMFLGIYYLLVKRYLLASIVLSILFLVKLQNLVIILGALFLSFLLSRQFNIIKRLAAFFLIVLFFSVYDDGYTLSKINYYSWKFYLENIKDINESFIPYSSYLDISFKSFIKGVYFYFRPLPWFENNLFQLIQFMENLIISIIIIAIWFKNYSLNLWRLYEIKFLNIFLILGIVLYGLVVYNSGTAARYKFPFIGVYVVFSFWYIYKVKFEKFVANKY